MKVNTIYRNLLWLVVAIPVIFSSCASIKDDLDDCGVYIEFIYDYNMEYTDAFDPWVPTVDVLVFDEQARYLFSKQAPRDQLNGGHRMYLGRKELPLGNYQILTIGGLTENFRLGDGLTGDLIPGQTSLDDVRIALKRTGATVDTEFPSLWVGPVIGVTSGSWQSVYPVYLIKNTNRFSLTLTRINEERSNTGGGPMPYTFEIMTPEGAVYGADNSPQQVETVTYKPYRLIPGNEPETVAAAQINTMRLFNDPEGKYRFIIRDGHTGAKIWDYDLIRLLAYMKPDEGPDGRALPMQEFLDRQSEWAVAILYQEGQRPDGTHGMTAIGLEVAGWIIWFNDIEIR